MVSEESTSAGKTKVHELKYRTHVGTNKMPEKGQLYHELKIRWMGLVGHAYHIESHT